MNWKHVITVLLKKILILKTMKTSNKILIGFAAALILIPVLGMVIVSATQYKTGTYNDRVDVVQQDISFKASTANMTSIALPSAFEVVNISDAKNFSLNIHFIKDKQFGVKITKEYKDLISVVLDRDGKLQLSFKDSKNSDQTRRMDYAIIYVYAPNLNALTVTNANDLIVKTAAEKLNLKLNKINSFYFDNGTEISQLDLEAVNTKALTIRRDKIKSVNVAITDSEFAIESMNLENVSITTNGTSKVNFYTNDFGDKNQIIKNLVLNTNGIADVKIDNTTIDKCSGSFSDQTTVLMPAININQMYKK